MRSIADMASYPWIVPHRNQGQDLADFPNLQRWFHDVPARRTLIEMLIEVRAPEDTAAIVRALEEDGHLVTQMASTAASEIS